MVPEYAVVMTLEAVIFLVLTLGVHVLSAADILVPIWLVLPLLSAGVATAAVALGLYAQTWATRTWLQEPAWNWWYTLKMAVFDDNVNLSVSADSLRKVASAAYTLYTGAWWAVVLNVLVIWVNDEGHVDGLWHMLFRRDLSVAMQVSTMKLNVMVGLLLLGIVALVLLPVAGFLHKGIGRKEDAVEQILEDRQNGQVYTIVCVSTLVQYTIYLNPLQKMMGSEHKYLWFALLPLGCDVVTHGILGRRLTLNTVTKRFEYGTSLALIAVSCAVPGAALSLLFFEQHLFELEPFWWLNFVLLTLLLVTRGVDCHVAITYARAKERDDGSKQPEAAESRLASGVRQPKFFFKQRAGKAKFVKKNS